MAYRVAWFGVALVCFVMGCSEGDAKELAPVTRPLPTSSPEQQKLEWQAAKQTFEQRCVVCHGCYDAPCQLKLSSWDGIARGATKEKVYEPSRLREAAPTRLNVDAQDVSEWRAKWFYPVLPENDQVDPRGALLTRMLEMKREVPLALDGQALPKEFEIGLEREEQCPNPDEFDEFKRKHPSWGMPYALPALSDGEHQALVGWVAAGTPHDAPAPLALPLEQSVAKWEAFLNQPGLKEQLVARYIYEHLFLGALYFEGVDEQTFFRVVRSRTAPGEPVDEIATRRPFEDPKTDTFYYRLVLRDDTRLMKTQLPYALSDARLERWRALFFEHAYEVSKAPGYGRETSANPFDAFSALPVGARYRFMLEEAWFTMAGFIKGPVCRGQVALNVIEDRFWIVFVSPESPIVENEAKLLEGAKEDLALPAEQGSTNWLVTWRRYGRQQERYLTAKSMYLEALADSAGPMSLTQIWDGDGMNQNAALTVMRHFDSATVVRGLVGGPSKTAWVVDYALLERIHYLLVAGYDVFGNVGHQLHSRMYMDFLRMEAEHNFLTLLPKAQRKSKMESWYRDASNEVKDHVYGRYAFYDREPAVAYQTAAPEQELYELLAGRVSQVRSRRYMLEDDPSAQVRDSLAMLTQAPGQAATKMPETSFVEVQQSAGGHAYYTILRDSAHTNVAELFREKDRRVTSEDQLTVLRGFVGSYPNALFSVAEADLPAFVAAVGALNEDESYDALRQRFGVRRTDPRFWAYSDRIHAAFRAQEPLESGLFDYNRLDGR